MPQAKNKKSAAKGSKKASEAAKVEQEQEPQAQVVVQDEEEEPSEVRPKWIWDWKIWKIWKFRPKVIFPIGGIRVRFWAIRLGFGNLKVDFDVVAKKFVKWQGVTCVLDGMTYWFDEFFLVLKQISKHALIVRLVYLTILSFRIFGVLTIPKLNKN